MKKLSAAIGIAALSLMGAAVQAQSTINDPLAQPSGSTSSGMPAEVTPGSNPSGLNNSSDTSGNVNSGGVVVPTDQNRPPSGATGTDSSSAPSASGSGSLSSPATGSSDPLYGVSSPRDPSLPATREQVQVDTVRAMRLGAINQGEEIPPQREQEFDRAHRFLQ